MFALLSWFIGCRNAGVVVLQDHSYLVEAAFFWMVVSPRTRVYY